MARKRKSFEQFCTCGERLETSYDYYDILFYTVCLSHDYKQMIADTLKDIVIIIPDRGLQWLVELPEATQEKVRLLANEAIFVWKTNRQARNMSYIKALCKEINQDLSVRKK